MNTRKAKQLHRSKRQTISAMCWDIVFAYSGIECTVVPMIYPACSKIPLIIRLSGLGTRLFWFHAHAAQERVAQELEGTLHDLIEEVVAVSA